MTPLEALRQCRDDVERLLTVSRQVLADMQAQDLLIEWQTVFSESIAAADAVLAQPAPEPVAQPEPEPVNPFAEARAYAWNLAVALHAKHFPEVTDWKPLPHTLGLLTQIDNMVSGLVRPAPTVTLPPIPKSHEESWSMLQWRAQIIECLRAAGVGVRE